MSGKYAVISYYFDNGTAKARILPITDDWQDSKEETSNYDKYVDVFDNIDEAMEFKRETLNV